MAPCRDCKKFKAEISRLEETNSNLLETISNLRDQLKNLKSLENQEPLVVPGPDLNWQFFDDSLEVDYIHKKDKFDNYIQKELKKNHWVHDLDSVFFVKQSKIDIDDIFIEAEDPDSEDLKSFLESERENLAPEPFVQDGIQFELHALPMEQRVVHGYYQPQTIRQSGGNHTNQLEFLVTLLPKVINHKNAKKFMKPFEAIEKGLYGYHTYTKTPMDLTTIQTRLKNHYYESASKCLEDFQQMITNCFFCQEDHDDFEDATALQAFGEEQIKSMPKPEVTLKNPSNDSVEVPTVNPVVNPQLGPVVSRKRRASSSAAPNPSTKPRVEEAAVDPSPSGSKPSFQCPHCDKEPYSNRQNMNRHVLTKHKSVKYSCPICGKPLGRSDNLKIHMRDRHSD